MIGEPKLNQSVQDEKTSTDKSQDAQVKASADKLTDGEKWIAGLPGKNFTIQLIVLADESSLQSFIKDNNLQGNAVYYRTEKNGKILHALVHGSFESYSLAKEAVDTLSSELKKSEPWIRNIATIQEILVSR
jgi:septal ring-binding cell division protein DamX